MSDQEYERLELFQHLLDEHGFKAPTWATLEGLVEYHLFCHGIAELRQFGRLLF